MQLTFFSWRGLRDVGRRAIPTPPTLTQIQLPSFLKRSPQELDHSNHEEDISEERKEDSVRNSFGEQSEKSLQSDKNTVVEGEDLEGASNKGEQKVEEKQILNDTSGDEPQRIASVPASKPPPSPQDQEKASDGAKDESQNLVPKPAAISSGTQLDRKTASDDNKDELKLSASEPAAESTSLQLDRKTTSDSSKDEPRLSVAESDPASDNSRQDTKKTQKGGANESQPASSQSRKPRKSQRYKKKFSG